MRKRILHIVVVAFAFVCVLACSGRGARVIPKKTFAKIYAEMALADQWLRDNYSLRPVADTSLFYEAVFARHGYTADDYRCSIEHYLQNPDEYKRIMDRSLLELRKLEYKYDKLRGDIDEQDTDIEKIKVVEE